jgi:hypothetical protein
MAATGIQDTPTHSSMRYACVLERPVPQQCARGAQPTCICIYSYTSKCMCLGTCHSTSTGMCVVCPYTYGFVGVHVPRLLYVCLYVRMYAYMPYVYILCSVYMCVCMYSRRVQDAHTYTHAHARTHARATLGAIGAYLHHVCRTVQAFVCMRVLMLMRLCIYVFVCARVCPTYAYTCMCAYVLCAGMYA